SRPSASHTRQPDARTIRSGALPPSPESSPGGVTPNRASGRLLPVDVNPGTRQSFTVLHHLDGHGPEELRLALVERRAVNHLAHRPQHALPLACFEELDPAQPPTSDWARISAAAGRGRC